MTKQRPPRRKGSMVPGVGANRDPKLTILRQANSRASPDRFTIGGRIRTQAVSRKPTLATIKFGTGEIEP